MGDGPIITVTGFLMYQQATTDGRYLYAIQTIGAHYWLSTGDYSAYVNKEVILQGVARYGSGAGWFLDVTSVELSNRPLLAVNLLLNAARQLLGVPYREPSTDRPDTAPTWLRDGVGDPPPVGHLQQVGVRSYDLINYALEANDRAPLVVAGNLVKSFPFDPSAPGQPGAIAVAFHGREVHVALYLDEHQLIQCIPSEGVTDRYTDEETYAWASQGWPRYNFTIYGFLPGVSY
jgi:hypothetical protein